MRGSGRDADETLSWLAVSGFLAELGQKLADRWLELLVMPGALWVVALAAATRLGQGHPFGVTRLSTWLDREAAQPGGHSLATVLLAAIGLLAAAAAVGLAASALGGIVQRAWVLPGWRWPLRWVVNARQRWWQRRWDRATTRLKKDIAAQANPAARGQELSSAERRVRIAERHRKALGVLPERLTPVADEFYSTAVRIGAACGLEDLDLAWPRLWTVLPDTLRTDLASAQDAYAAAARLTAWGLLYALLAIAWWPAAVLGVTVAAAGWLRGRSAASVLADLIETATDLHTVDLAAKLGIPAPLPVTAETGRAIIRFLRKATLPDCANAPASDSAALPAPRPGRPPVT